LFFNPASHHSTAAQKIQISDDSLTLIYWEWKIPSPYSNQLIVNPNSIEITSHEALDCLWEFHPDRVGDLKVEIFSGFVRINSMASESLCLTNHPDSQMHFFLHSNSKPKNLFFTPADDILPTKSTNEIKYRCRPKAPGDVKGSICCNSMNQSLFQKQLMSFCQNSLGICFGRFHT
jgi:hypothetical protein